MSDDPESFERLHHRRQYLLGPREAERAPASFARKGFKHLYLAHHPDLSVSLAEGELLSVAVLGEILDPLEPTRSNSDIARALADNCSSETEIIERTEHLGGRWVLLIAGPDRTVLLQDCSGFRTAAFTRTSEGTWCASDTSLLAEELGLPVAEEVTELVRCQYYARDTWLPFHVTAIRDCRQLVANHLLDLDQASMERYWPRRPRAVMDIKTASERAAKYLRGMVNAAAARSPLSVSMTAGKDSRIIFAATRDVSADCFYYTTYRPGENYRIHADTRIPGMMLKHFGLKHNVINASAPLPSWLQRVYRANTTISSLNREGLTNAWWEHLPANSWRTTGHQGADNLFQHLNVPAADHLGALLPIWNSNNLARQVTQDWLEEASSKAREYDHALSDLFYSEFRLSRWAAHHQAQYDLAIESFGPHNCRALLEAMQSVPIEERVSGRLYEEVVRQLWPQLLDWPINPESKLEFLIRKLKRTRIGNFYSFKVRKRNIDNHHIAGKPVARTAGDAS